MEGLIPYILTTFKRQKSQRRHRSSSEMSSIRSYYQPLNSTKGSSEGSSHRRTRSDFQPPVGDWVGQVPGAAVQHQFFHSRSLKTDYSSSFSQPDPEATNDDETASNSHLRR